jgi:hypothetical protein
MTSRKLALCLAAVALCWGSVASAQVAADPGAARTAWPDAPRVLAFADVHGAYDELVPLLRAAGILDASDRWAAGTAHVVSTGDLLDRGGDSRKVMDLLMRLQGEALSAGGRLHVVLGNHEAMNLLGDLRYVVAAEYASYAPDEPQDVRDRERERWVARGKTAAEFDQRFPPGYFGHRALLAPRGRYGAWLSSLPVAITVNDTLFMHGGPSTALAGLSLAEVNLRYRTALVGHLQASTALFDAGLLFPDDAFADWARLAAERLPEAQARDAQRAQDLADAVARFARVDRDPLLEADGPNWYRGTALCNEVSESDVLRPLLAGLNVRRLVIGHTVAHDGRAASRFDAAVIKLDTGMNRPAYHGHPAVLVLERERPPAVIYAEQPTPQAIPAEPGYLSSTEIPEADVAVMLAYGEVVPGATRPDGAVDVQVRHEGRSVAAVFVAADKSAVAREAAAWAVDRELDLGIVPATVIREIGGKRGYLQARPPRYLTQAEVQARGARGGGACALEPQFQLMYGFDALIGNDGRSPERMQYDASQWTVFVTNHDRAFGSGSAFPAYLKANPPRPGVEFRRRLEDRLDADWVAATLGPWLSAREQRALLARRAALLALPAAAAAGTGR